MVNLCNPRSPGGGGRRTEAQGHHPPQLHTGLEANTVSQKNSEQKQKSNNNNNNNYLVRILVVT